MISIIIPAHNEEKRIEKTLREYLRFFKILKKQKALDFEIILVINNTRDRTEDIVKKYAQEFKEIRYLNFKQGGKGFAIIEGFKEALKNKKNDLIGFVDADMATYPEDFYNLIKNIHDADGIFASRWIKGSIIKTKQTLLRRFLSRGFNFIVRVFFSMSFKDTQCGAKIFRRKVIEDITEELKITQWAFDVNLLYLCNKKGFKLKEHPTVWEDKTDSKLNAIRAPMQMFSGVLRLWVINSRFEPILRPIKPIVHLIHRFMN